MLIITSFGLDIGAAADGRTDRRDSGTARARSSLQRDHELVSPGPDRSTTEISARTAVTSSSGPIYPVHTPYPGAEGRLLSIMLFLLSDNYYRSCCCHCLRYRLCILLHYRSCPDLIEIFICLFVCFFFRRQISETSFVCLRVYFTRESPVK